MTAKELLDKYNAGQRGFVEDALRGVDLRGADLRGAYLRGAYLLGADLRGAYLLGACLLGACLRGADLRGAYLLGADLLGADLRDADLRDAYFFNADMYDAKLGGSTVLASGIIGPAYSSGRYTTYLVLKDRTIHVITGCFSGTIEEMDSRSADLHTGPDRAWYKSAIAHIRLSAEQTWRKAKP